MGTSLNGRDDRNAYVGYVIQSLNAFVVNLAPNARISDIAERGPIDISNELPTCTCENYDLVRSILRNPVEGIDKFRVGLRSHNERPAVAVEFSYQHTSGVSSDFFLNNAGESGMVFVDANGVRRLNVLVGPDNDAKIERFGSDGKPIPQLKP